MRDSERVDEGELVDLLDPVADDAVDLARLNAGVVTRRQHRLAGKVELCAAQILGELGLADPGDRSAVPQPPRISHPA